MEDKPNILRDLSALEKQQNPPQRILRIGFNQRRKPNSHKLRLPNLDLVLLNRAEDELKKINKGNRYVPPEKV